MLVTSGFARRSEKRGIMTDADRHDDSEPQTAADLTNRSRTETMRAAERLADADARRDAEIAELAEMAEMAEMAEIEAVVDARAVVEPPRERVFSRKVLAFWALVTIAVYVAVQLVVGPVKDRIREAVEARMEPPEGNTSGTTVAPPPPVEPVAPIQPPVPPGQLPATSGTSQATEATEATPANPGRIQRPQRPERRR